MINNDILNETANIQKQFETVITCVCALFLLISILILLTIFILKKLINNENKVTVNIDTTDFKNI
jgi:flagellar biogenesis protein FliO